MSMNREDNAKITLVENGAPMGEFLRENFWFPALLSITLKPGGDPEPVRLIGEDLVAFRADDGRVAIFDEYCPHRRASLLLGRVEGDKLRCIFHGWAFNVEGKTVEAPTQSEHHEQFCKRVPLIHYPTREAGGIIWVWLGRKNKEPAPFPAFEFTTMSGDRLNATTQLLKFNWISSVEGLVDSAHVSYLHRDWVARADTSSTSLSSAQYDAAPKITIDDQPYGFRYAATRKVGPGKKYVRVTAFAAPFYSFIPYGTGQCQISVPVDDHTTRLFAVQWSTDGPLPPSAYGPTDQPENFPPYLAGGKDKRWGQNRDAMRRGSFSGFIEHLNQEDYAVAESQGAIADRSREFLSESDKAVVKFRKLILDGVNKHLNGETVDYARGENIRYGDVYADAKVLDEAAPWQEAMTRG